MSVAAVCVPGGWGGFVATEGWVLLPIFFVEVVVVFGSWYLYCSVRRKRGKE